MADIAVALCASLELSTRWLTKRREAGSKLSVFYSWSKNGIELLFVHRTQCVFCCCCCEDLGESAAVWGAKAEGVEFS